MNYISNDVWRKGQDNISVAAEVLNEVRVEGDYTVEENLENKRGERCHGTINYAIHDDGVEFKIRIDKDTYKRRGKDIEGLEADAREVYNDGASMDDAGRELYGDGVVDVILAHELAHLFNPEEKNEAKIHRYGKDMLRQANRMSVDGVNYGTDGASHSDYLYQDSLEAVQNLPGYGIRALTGPLAAVEGVGRSVLSDACNVWFPFITVDKEKTPITDYIDGAANRIVQVVKERMEDNSSNDDNNSD